MPDGFSDPLLKQTVGPILFPGGSWAAGVAVGEMQLPSLSYWKLWCHPLFGSSQLLALLPSVSVTVCLPTYIQHHPL